jgi:hypothetical protein
MFNGLSRYPERSLKEQLAVTETVLAGRRRTIIKPALKANACGWHELRNCEQGRPRQRLQQRKAINGSNTRLSVTEKTLPFGISSL